MTQTAWVHSPNAKHIDWVLASVEANPEKWGATSNPAWDTATETVYDTAYNTARDSAWSKQRDESRNPAWYALLNAAYGKAYGSAYIVATGAMTALITWDDCAYMIESEVGELKIIAAFGDPRAILLLPACIVFNETNALTNASITV